MFASSSEISIEFENIKESILFLHEDLLSAYFVEGNEQNVESYAKIFASLKDVS